MRQKKLIEKEMEASLSWERARNVCIVKTLAKLGHFPSRTMEKEAWFLSPLRSEMQASFNVSLVNNLWYDFGEGKGGSVIDLIMILLNCSLQESLLFLSENLTPFLFQPQAVPPKAKDNCKITISKILELQKPALLQYLRHRSIPVEISQKYCREVHYQLKGKEYFSIGLQNHLGGWELRNKYCKNSTASKSYTYLKTGANRLIITEGMFDFLSLVTLEEELVKYSDAIILNSVAFIKDMEQFIPSYEDVLLFLDNDPAGDKATHSLLQHYTSITDRRNSYNNHKDLNDHLRNERREKMRREGT